MLSGIGKKEFLQSEGALLAAVVRGLEGYSWKCFSSTSD